MHCLSPTSSHYPPHALVSVTSWPSHPIPSHPIPSRRACRHTTLSASTSTSTPTPTPALSLSAPISCGSRPLCLFPVHYSSLLLHKTLHDYSTLHAATATATATTRLLLLTLLLSLPCANLRPLRPTVGQASAFSSTRAQTGSAWCGKPTLDYSTVLCIFFSPTSTCTPSYLYLPPSPPSPPSSTPKPPPTAFISVVGLPSLPCASPSPLGLSAISRLRLKCVCGPPICSSFLVPSRDYRASQPNHRSAFY